MNCNCRWDGNLDGKLMRCQEHALAYKQERKAWKEFRAQLRKMRNDHGSV